MKSVCVFCGSSSGARSAYRETAILLGQELAQRRLRLVYGGGNIGLMGIVADAMLAAGGVAIGVIPQALVDKEVAHWGLTELHIVESMHQRKAQMADLADAFIALPGGFGTLEEFCEMLTWAQLGLHAKPCGLLNVEGFYDPLLALFDRAVADRFLRPEQRVTVLASQVPGDLLQRLAECRPIQLDKWIDRSQS
jgi:uncharacterized protein (TIGR00730 family)